MSDVLAIAAKLGPVLKEHLPQLSSIERMKLGEYLAVAIENYGHHQGGYLEAVDDGMGNDWFGDQDRKREASSRLMDHIRPIE